MIGEIKAFARAIQNPQLAGLLPCNGTPFSASTYPELAAVLGGSITPDYTGRFLKGSDSGGETGSGLMTGDMIPAYSDDGSTDEVQGTIRAKAAGGETIYATEAPDVPQVPVMPPFVAVVFYIQAR